MHSPILLLSLLLLGCRNKGEAIETGAIDGGETVPTDADSDGYDETEDCDDANSVVNPGADEICDGIDNNCDGVVDEGVTDPFYADADGDGFGDPESITESCETPDGHVATGTDCDDTSADNFPGAPERCDEVDNDCDGEVDEGVTTTWYADGDGDGHGDARSSIESCDPEQGYVDSADDCDDTESAAFPGNPEVCDEVDNNCDGTADEGVTTTYYEDFDVDSYGISDVTTESCDLPTGYAEASGDCDDAESAINPDAAEVCDSVDNNCDGTIDEDTALDAMTLYADDDADGYGDAADTVMSCVSLSGYLTDATDCDDTDSAINPDELEAWYDGIDADCDGLSDYDADLDGDDALDYGGGDCDDEDASVYEGEGCRPEADCTHPSTTTLASSDPSGVSDILFDDDCSALVSTIISGTDYVYTIDSTGSTSSVSGYSTHNIQSIALDPLTGDLMVSHNNNSAAGIGYSSGGSTITNLVSSTYNNGSLWSNTYMNRSSGSLAWDSSGCVWAPGFSGSGTLTCVEADGTTTDIIASGSHIESVALDSDEDLYIAIGDTVYLTDTSTGAQTTYFTAGDDILDMVFDYNDDLYVENDSGEIELVPGDGTSSSVYDTVSGQGRLAISPDGYLVRVIPAPISAATYEEWSLE